MSRIAADLSPSLSVEAPVPYLASYDWTGWYVGAHVGVIRGSSNWSSTQLGPAGPALNGTLDLPFNFDLMGGTGGYVTGLQGGYNRVFPSRLILGIEADASSHVGFVPPMDLYGIYKALGQTFFDRNIRAALKPDNAPSKKIREVLDRIVLKPTEHPSVFEQ